VNRIRSSRRLEWETWRNLEVLWLIEEQHPSHTTIADFRKNNAKALKAAHRDFILLCQELDLVGGELVGIDGSFFKGDVSKDSFVTDKGLKERIAKIDQAIEQWQQLLEETDQQEARQLGPKLIPGQLAEKLAELKQRRAEQARALKQLQAEGKTQHSRTDADARLLSKPGQKVAGYNVQIAVDAKHKLIIGDEVSNAPNDLQQLHPLASEVKARLGVDKLEAVADPGYYSHEQLKACLDEGITPWVAAPDRTASRKEKGQFSQDDYSYEAEQDCYRCPAGEVLTRRGNPVQRQGKIMHRYASQTSSCNACAQRQCCLSPKGTRKEIERWEHAEVIEAHDQSMQTAQAKAKIARRKSLVEHPFGTLKRRCGWDHFLVRGLPKVSGEWTLMALGYNFSRVLNILGVVPFRRCLEQRCARPESGRLLRTLRPLFARIGSVFVFRWSDLHPRILVA
jgi:DDE family transposase/transposase-like protein DUF772